MTKVLVWVEHDGATVKDATLSAVTAASQIGDVIALVVGSGVGGVATLAAQIAGVTKVLVADDAKRLPLPQQLADGLQKTVPRRAVHPARAKDEMPTARFGAFVAPATTTGKNVAPRVAALIDVAQVSDILSVEGPKTFTRPIYAGNAIATVESTDAKLVITVRGTAFAKADATGGSASVEPVAAGAESGLSTYVGSEIAKLERPELTSAKIIVSGGRALKDAATFAATITPLADKLGAAIGASRAAVDAGYVPNDYQVGQTGKIVAPQIYIAVGISGAIQHLAGMKDSKTIIAINKDEDAPIFQVADIGLVADLFTAVPDLASKL